MGDRDRDAMKWSTNGSLTPNARLKRRVDAWAVKLRVMPRVIRVQQMTRKWGSCSTAGTITLAIDLDDESERFQDFVIVHELLHLKVPNHGRLFKALISVHVPNWRKLAMLSRRSRELSLNLAPSHRASRR
jgi:predicted metal-dependent hydrolase